MGVLPLEFTGGETRHTHQIDGTETFTVEGSVSPGAALMVRMTRTDGSEVILNVKCRLDTAEEVSIYSSGGVLQRFAQDFLDAQAS